MSGSRVSSPYSGDGGDREQPGLSQPIREFRIFGGRRLVVVDPLGFAEVPVLPEVEAVVGGEEYYRVVGEVQRVELRQKASHPEVHHRDLAAVGRVGERHVVFGEPGFLVLRVCGVELASVVPRPVLLGIVLRRVPGLVRIPGVHVEEERLLVFVVPL